MSAFTHLVGWACWPDVPPCHEELIYGKSEQGLFVQPALKTRSRYYLQVPLTEKNVEDWSDERFWDELKSRMLPEDAKNVVTGASLKNRLRHCAAL